GAAVEKWEVETMLLLQAPRGCQLRFGVVDSDYSRAAPCQPGRDVCSAAAEFDRILTRETAGKDVELRFGDTPYAPPRLDCCPPFFARRNVLWRPIIPQRAIATDVVRQITHGIFDLICVSAIPRRLTTVRSSRDSEGPGFVAHSDDPAAQRRRASPVRCSGELDTLIERRRQRSLGFTRQLHGDEVALGIEVNRRHESSSATD